MPHVVQFFSADDAGFIEDLAWYVRDAVDAGEPVVLVTGSVRGHAVSRALERLGAEPAFLREDGRLVLLDAHEIVRSIAHRGGIDSAAFEARVGLAVRDVVSRSRSGRARVYGDMVGILWQQGRRAEALALERAWQDLLAEVAFDLFCGYPIDIFTLEFSARAVEPLLEAHTHVRAQRRNGVLQNALDYALYESIGRRLQGDEIAARFPALPSAEATVLWLREQLPEIAPAIVERARAYADSASP